MDTIVTLIQEVFHKDRIGQEIPSERKREVFCTVRGITRSEWVSAGQNGIRASVVLVLPAVNYEGERLVVWNGQRKLVYRTYTPPDTDEIELYLQDEAGGL